MKFFAYFQETPTYFNEHYLVAAPASTEQKHQLWNHGIQAKTPLPPAKNTQLHSLDSYHQMTMISQLIGKQTPMFECFNVLHFTEAATSICSLKKVLTTCDQKPLSFKWLCLLTIINFIIAQLFAKHRFLKNTYLWLLLTSKSFSEFDSMFCYHEVRLLKKGFSQLFFVWSVKWWVSLKLWNNYSRDWINNFPKWQGTSSMRQWSSPLVATRRWWKRCCPSR